MGSGVSITSTVSAPASFSIAVMRFHIQFVAGGFNRQAEFIPRDEAASIWNAASGGGKTGGGSEATAFPDRR